MKKRNKIPKEIKLKFKKNNRQIYFQDHHILIGVPHAVTFSVTHLDENKIKLTAPGYGLLKKQGKYGNGSIYMFTNQLTNSQKEYINQFKKIGEKT